MNDVCPFMLGDYIIDSWHSHALLNENSQCYMCYSFLVGKRLCKRRRKSEKNSLLRQLLHRKEHSEILLMCCFLFCFVWLTATVVELESFDLELEKFYAWVNQACETKGFQSDHLKA